MPDNRNNDDWAVAASDYFADIMSRYLLGMGLTPAEQRVIDVLRMRIGPAPESVEHYRDRLLQPKKEPTKTVNQVVQGLPPGARISGGRGEADIPALRHAGNHHQSRAGW